MVGSNNILRKSSNDASGNRSKGLMVLTRNHSARSRNQRRSMNGSGNRPGSVGKKCFKIVVISERTVTISDLIAVIKKTCKLTRCRYQDEASAAASNSIFLRSDEKSYLHNFCKCSLPEETPLTADINHTGKTYLFAIIVYLN